MIDHEKLKVRLQAESPLQPPTPAEEAAPGGVEPVAVKTQCPVCHWGLRVTVEPVEVAG